MPAFLTHWRVLIETARRSQDAGNDLGSLIIDTSALQRRAQGGETPPHTPPAGAVWDTGPLPEIDYSFPGSDISAMAYLGALAPDITSYLKNNFKDKISDYRDRKRLNALQSIGGNRQWAHLLHSNRSGDVLLTFLEHIADIPSPALRSQSLAFAMGYLSHIATDIALNPCINALANTYAARNVLGKFAPLGMHFYTEICLDEYISATYFNRYLYGWISQPWGHYIEPVATSCTIPSTIPARVLDLLASAVEGTYGLTGEESTAFRVDNLAGLQRLRAYLAGRGSFRLFSLQLLVRKRKDDPIIASIAADAQEPGITSFEEAIMYAIRLSEHLCRRAISYYASLRNSKASAQERNSRRIALCNDLRNWNLSNGYAMDIIFDQEVTLQLLHNWVHFARLWNHETEDIAQAQHF